MARWLLVNEEEEEEKAGKERERGWPIIEG